MEIKLRKVKKSDWPQLERLYKEFRVYNLKIIKKTGVYLQEYELPFKRQDFLKLIARKNKLFMVALDKEKIVGFVLARLKKEKYRGKSFLNGNLSEIFITQKYRGKGIAEKMWQITLRWFKKQKIKSLQLNVFYENKTPFEIYKFWGFKPFVVIMKKKLK
jgi:ribosomal protein S18 acetylase RimI-like enzyme